MVGKEITISDISKQLEQFAGRDKWTPDDVQELRRAIQQYLQAVTDGRGSESYSELQQILSHHNQEHLLQWWPDLKKNEQQALKQQIQSIDFGNIKTILDNYKKSPVREIPRDTRPPSKVVRLPDSKETSNDWKEADRIGREVLSEGKVGVLLVAGGRGNRLNYEYAKGIFPIGPVSHSSLYRILAEKVAMRSREAGVAIPYYIMTSDETHDETVAHFRQNRHFGLEEGVVTFFRQGNMPAVDRESGRVLLAGKGQIAMSPNGNGGIFGALTCGGHLEKMRENGIRYLFYHNVDNPAVKVCDPAFLGFHKMSNSEMSTKVVRRMSPNERVGLLAEINGTLNVVEYSERPEDLSANTEQFWHGNTAIHVINRELLERMTERGMPYHVAVKALPFLGENGKHITPEPKSPNAFQLEQFYFDMLPHAANALVVETDRDEFQAVKNRDGENSPESVRKGLTEMHANWLRKAGLNIPDGAVVEIHPSLAQDEEELVRRLQDTVLFSIARVFLS